MKICYNAIFEFARDGINVTFPDVPEAFTCAYSRDEAISMAQEVLDLVLHRRKFSELPKSTSRNDITVQNNMEVVSVSISMNEKNGVLLGKDIIDLE